MGLPAVVGDIGVGYSNGQVVASFPIIAGSAKVFIGGKAVAGVGSAITAGGQIIAGAPITTKTLVDGSPVYLIGAVTALPGWAGGTLIGAGAGAVQMT